MNDETNVQKNSADEVRYNLGASQLEMIAFLMQKSIDYYLKGDLISYYFSLRAIKNQIYPRLKKTERLKLKVYEDAFSKLNYTNNDNGNNRNKVCRVVEDYNLFLQEMLEVKGYLVPAKEDRTGLFGQGDDLQ